MRNRTKLGLCLVVAVLCLLLALPVAAASVAPVPRPNWNNGSPEVECSQIGYSFGLKVEGTFNGTYVAFGTQTITVSNAVGSTFDWSSTFGVDAVAVKAGQGANVYFYNESFGDTQLLAFEGKNISHITFCWDYELTASKTASGSFTRTYTWTIDKSVAPDTHSGFAGANFSSDYDVYVDQTVADSNFVVSGTITVNNPTPFAVNFSVSDLVNGTAASVNCPASQVPAFGSIVCTYSAGLGGAVDGTNTATVSSSTAGVAGASASTGYTFVANIVGFPTVNVTDSVKGPLVPSASGDQLYEYSSPFSCPTNTSLYVNGFYSFSVPNTATINETGQNDSANVTVNCYLPLVSKDAVASYDETHSWTLAKSVTPENQTGVVGDVLPWTWTVDVSETSADRNFKVIGTITVTNPAPFPMTVFVTDVLSDGTLATVDCGGGSASLTVAANSPGQCSYVAMPTTRSATTNTASASINAVSVNFTAAVNFVKNVIGGSATVTDTEIGLNEVLTAGTGSWKYTADDSHTCSSNSADYGTGGSYSGSVPNTANLSANNGQNDSDDATTSYTCYAPVVTKTAAGQYDERHDWSIVKTVDPEDQSGYPGDPVNWTWTIVIDETVSNENYVVTGTITVNNPSPDDAMTVDVADVLDDLTVATVDCGGGLTSLTVQPLAPGVCTYSAAPDDALATLNTATATFNGVPFTATAQVAFTPIVLNDSATFSDPYLNIADTVVYDDSSIEDYPDGDICLSNSADYAGDGKYEIKVSNTAYLVDEEGTPYESTAETSYTCEAAFVEVFKTTNGAVNPNVDWTFVLYEGPDGYGSAPIDTSTTAGDLDGVIEFDGPALRPDRTYTICEVGSPVGYLSNWQVNGVDIEPYSPDDPDQGNRCVDFGAGTDFPLSVVQILSFVVDNVTPGGDPRTPGYWKNWTSCGKGNQVATAARNGGWQNGFWLLEDVLAQSVGGAIVWDDILVDNILFSISTCQTAVSILDNRDIGTGRVSASDPGFKLARNLLAAQLNFGAGACTTADVLSTAQLAEALLDKYNYDGIGKSGLSKADETLALSYATIMDNYNNGDYCGSFNP